MSSYLSQKGFLPVFFEKYGFTFDKSQPLATEAVTKLDMGVKGDPTYWVTSTLYTGSTCDGDVVSVVRPAFLPLCSLSHVILLTTTPLD
jgi:hypothetical protein